MQEMNLKTINFYFKNIQNNIKDGGYFFNLNRYEKTIGKEQIKFEKFPYDKKWLTTFSQRSIQDTCHLLVTQRNKKEKNFIVKDEINLFTNNINKSGIKETEIEKQNKIVNTNLLQLINLGKNVEVKSFEKNYKIEDINDSTLLYIFGTNRLILNEYYEAKLYLKNSIKLNSNFCEAFANLAVVFDNQGDHKNALFYYDKALEINPSHSTTLINKSHIYNKKLRPDEVIKTLSKLPQSLHDIDVLNLFSKNYLRLDDYKNALSFAKRAYKKDPKNMIALNNIGRAYLDPKENKKDKKNKNFHEALKYFEKMIVIDEFSVEALFNIATVYDKLSNEKKLKNIIEEFLILILVIEMLI